MQSGVISTFYTLSRRVSVPAIHQYQTLPLPFAAPSAGLKGATTPAAEAAAAAVIRHNDVTWSEFHCLILHVLSILAASLYWYRTNNRIFDIDPPPNPGSMNKILCSEYSSKIYIELNWNELNFTFYFILSTFVLIYMYCMYMYSCVLTASKQ